MKIVKETSNSILEYKNKIMYVRLKEGVEITIESMKEQYAVQESMLGNEVYGVLVDATNNINVTNETRDFMAAYTPANRKATAIINNRNLATLILANFYLKWSKPHLPTKLFKHEEDAVKWLTSNLERG